MIAFLEQEGQAVGELRQEKESLAESARFYKEENASLQVRRPLLGIPGGLGQTREAREGGLLPGGEAALRAAAEGEPGPQGRAVRLRGEGPGAERDVPFPVFRG